MRTFRTFIVEETTPFHTVTEVPAKKALIDVHIALATAKPGMYGKSKIGTEIPDRPMKHVQVNFGKHKFKGWGESHDSLSDTGLPVATRSAHQSHVDAINRFFTGAGEPPMSIKRVHTLYAPRRTLIHLTNGTHEMAMTYSQGITNGSGLRNYITTNGTKVPASQAANKSMHTGEEDYTAVNNQARALTISPYYHKPVDGVNTHDVAGKLVYTGNEETHKIIWDKVKETHARGWKAGTAIPLMLHSRSDDPIMKKEIQMYFPGIR